MKLEFKQLELEWIDLPTASVDAVLCRWGYMLTVDPAAGMRETRRVLRPAAASRSRSGTGRRRIRGRRSRPTR